MDDTCIVCAETLEWVAYGSCGHHEVCSTCVARLRFICNDRRCCLCKSESSVIFVTKALGDYTRLINDFSVFPANPTEGQVGPYWYHEGTQAYFDDSDHYMIIKAMCRLSCSACNKMEEQMNESSKKRGGFKNVEHLKSHLFHCHKLFMCILCLEGRKIFICEQKLYTGEQLNQHIKTGDSEVDGSESERGGFMGHPMCEFCQNPFYGDNELYLHMSTEHYTCHICQRQHPGQYDYYKNYDDLEIHFRGEHFLCEDEGCLAKKFIVFTTDSEMKKHNAMEHGGKMSRSKRNAVLQIPTSFHYRRSTEQDRRERRRGLHPDSIDAWLESANANSSSNAQAVSNHREIPRINSIASSFELLATTDTEPPLTHHQQSSRNAPPLEGASFPPLPLPTERVSFPPLPSSNRKKSKKKSKAPSGNTMAARLRCQNNETVTVPRIHQHSSLANTSLQLRPISNTRFASSSGCAPSQNNETGTVLTRLMGLDQPTSSAANTSSQLKPAKVKGLIQTNYASSAQASSSNSTSPANTSQSKSAKVKGLVSSAKVSSSSSASSATNNFIKLLVQSPQPERNLKQSAPFNSSTSNFPPVSVTPTKNPPLLKVEDVHTANKSLVERIRSALEFDEDKFSAFKEISSEYRQNLIDTGEYILYVHQFGLSHLLLELAKMCPDAQKQKELVEAYNFSVKVSKKGKEKSEDNGMNRFALLKQVNQKVVTEEDVEVLSKDGYRSSKGKSKIDVGSANQPELSGNDYESKKDLLIGGGRKKQRKKTSKFERVRLGGDSVSATPLEVSDSDPKEKTAGLPVRGVWKNGGGRRLVKNLL